MTRPPLPSKIARYAHALVYGDFATVGAVLERAARNPALDRATMAWHVAEESAMQRRNDEMYAAIGDDDTTIMNDDEDDL